MKTNWLLKKLAELTGIKRIMDDYIDRRIYTYLSGHSTAVYREGKWSDKVDKGFDAIRFPLTSTIQMVAPINSLVGKSIYFDEFEKAEVGFVKSFLKNGDVFIDIGANIGLFSLIAAEAVGKDGRVYAFEPNPKTFNVLEQNIQINQFSQVECIMEALADKAGEMAFYSFKNGYDAYSSFAPTRNDVTYDMIDVKVNTFDVFWSSVPDSLKKRIKLIKIDVEGWELPVMNGAETLLKSSNAPALLVEFTNSNAEIAGFGCHALFQKGLDLGYSWYHLSGRHFKPASIGDDFTYVNLLAIKHMEIGWSNYS